MRGRIPISVLGGMRNLSSIVLDQAGGHVISDADVEMLAVQAFKDVDEVHQIAPPSYPLAR
jgi:hypothetical protein